MKKTQMAVVIICIGLLGLIGCAKCDQDFVAQMEQENIATVKHIHAEAAKGNMAVFNECLTENYVRHCQSMPPELQRIEGADKLRTFCEEFYQGVSNYTDELSNFVADSNMVAYVSTMKATHTGDMNGLPASNKEFICVNIIIQRFEEGRVAETWVSWDNLAMLSQLGFFPPPENQQP